MLEAQNVILIHHPCIAFNFGFFQSQSSIIMYKITGLFFITEHDLIISFINIFFNEYLLCIRTVKRNTAP